MQIVAETPQLSVIALDTEMPDMNGVIGLRQMIAQCSGLIPVALIGSMRRSNEIRDYLTAGAAGYLTYSLSAKALLAGLRMINVGEVYVPAEILAQEEQVTRTGRHWLTGRERDVLNGLLSGQSNKEIARTHGLSEVTIKHHLKSLRSKLGARNRTHAVCRAIELGIAEDAGSVMSYSTA
jgi:DNA-binding NarL/FixJ family response regulator